MIPHVNTNLLVLETFSNGVHECPRENHQEQESYKPSSCCAWNAGERQSPTPLHQGKCTAVPQSACEPSLVWGRETSFIWVRQDLCPPEGHHEGVDPSHRGHCVLQNSILGLSADLCPSLPGCSPPDLASPSAEGGKSGFLPLARHHLNRTRRCRSGLWLALGNWPALFPQNFADTLGALKWVNKVLQDAETQRPPLIPEFVGHLQVQAGFQFWSAQLLGM